MPDDQDPCALLVEMERARDDLMTGKAVAAVREADREVRYTMASMSALRERIAELRMACEQKRGRRSRHAIRCGFR